MRMSVLKYLASGILAGALMGCLDSGVNQTQSESAIQSPNNSDPSKSNYQPITSQGEAYRARKIEMLKKIDPNWAEHLAAPEPQQSAQPAAKASATTSTVGFLVNYLQSTNFDIFMDTENDGNGDYLGKTGTNFNETSLQHITRVSSNHGGMLFHVSRTNMSTLPREQWDYATILLSDNCPTNGYRFSEIFDNEDTGNQDYATASVYPGWSRRDWTGTKLKFCFVPGTGTVNTDYPPWYNGGNGGAVFALPGKTYFSWTSTVYPFKSYSCDVSEEALLDGEDDGFAGSIDYETVPTAYRSRIAAIMDIRYGAPHFFINACPAVPVGI